MKSCYGEVPLAPEIVSRQVDAGDLAVHVLEAGRRDAERCIVLLHGFPELAYSWRQLMPLLAAAGYYVIAADQRGYGRTIGWDADYDGELAPFRLLNLARDVERLLAALGRRSVHSIVGHDFGAPVAAWCALLRPDVFRSAALLSAPFAGPPSPAARTPATLPCELAALDPPRKHYQWYYSTRRANADMLSAPQGLPAFLRAYYHCKSGDWEGNRPVPLSSWQASELGKMPRYYIMDEGADMAQTVAHMAPNHMQIEGCAWLTEAELGVYASEFARTGFQGGLQWYRNVLDGAAHAELRSFAGRRIEIPTCFIAGQRDWGPYQSPGALNAMEKSACSCYRGTHFIESAGHWVQQEQPQALAAVLLDFFATN